MKTLYLIGGAMGSGKTSVCQKMKNRLKNSVFLDGDWCWDSHPFQVTEETKAMVMRNICFLLNQFLRCSAYEYVIFCWVMHEQHIIDTILANIDKKSARILSISLICEYDTLRTRLEKDITAGLRKEDIIERSIKKLPFYDRLNTIKVHTDRMNTENVADYILAL